MNSPLYKTVIATILGNIIELYDHALFGVLSYLLVSKYFPSSDAYSNIIYAVGIFSISHFARPLGAIISAYHTKNASSETYLIISLSLMGLSSLVIALLPNFEIFGYVSSVLLIIARFAQGLSVSCEFPASMLILSSLSKNRKGFIASLSFASGVSGMLLGTLVITVITSVLSKESFNSWGWRIPFFIGFVLCLSGYFFRKTILKSKKRQSTNNSPVINCLKTSKFPLFIAITIISATSSGFYTLFSYIPAKLLGQHALSTNKIALVLSLSMSFYIIFLMLSGYLSDLFGRDKLIIFGGLFLAVVNYSCIAAINSGDIWLTAAGMILLAISIAIIAGPIPAILGDIFQSENKGPGVYLGYNLGQTFAGGTVPLILAYMSKLNNTTNSLEVMYCLVALILSVTGFFIPKIGVEASGDLRSKFKNI